MINMRWVRSYNYFQVTWGIRLLVSLSSRPLLGTPHKFFPDDFSPGLWLPRAVLGSKWESPGPQRECSKKWDSSCLVDFASPLPPHPHLPHPPASDTLLDLIPRDHAYPGDLIGSWGRSLQHEFRCWPTYHPTPQAHPFYLYPPLSLSPHSKYFHR